MRKYSFRTVIDGETQTITVNAMDVIDALREWEKIAVGKSLKNGQIRLTPAIDSVIAIQIRK